MSCTPARNSGSASGGTPTSSMNASGRGPRARPYRPATAASRTPRTPGDSLRGEQVGSASTRMQVRLPQRLDDAPRPLGRLALGVGLERDEQRRPDRRRASDRRLAVAPRDRQQPAVEQVARDRLERSEVQAGPHRGVERRETEQREARPAGQRHGSQRRRGDERRAFLPSRRAASRGPGRRRSARRGAGSRSG